MISRIGRNPNNAGYTLIELILLAAILAVIIAIAVPLFKKTFSGLELSESAYNLTRLVGYAQEKAVSEGARYKLVLDKKNARYYLLRRGLSFPEKYNRLAGKPGKYFILPRGFNLRSDKKEVVIYPDGHCEKAVIIFSGKDTYMKITLTGKLGNVKIDKGARR